MISNTDILQDLTFTNKYATYKSFLTETGIQETNLEMAV